VRKAHYSAALNMIMSASQCSPHRGFFWRWSSYNNFALDKATVAACPIQIAYVRLPLGIAPEKSPRPEKR
jgi:hypothetical protein